MNACLIGFVVFVLSCASFASADFDVRDHMASMTTYESRQCARPDKDYEPPEGCKLLSLDMVLRHGSRYPTDKNIEMINTLLDLIHEYPDQLKMDWMKSWQPPFSLDDQGLLCSRGVGEHREIGANISRFFKDAVLPYNANEVQFTCTYKDRTSQSAEAFGNGMVNDEGKTPIAVTSKSKGDDIILRFFDICARYRKEVHDNPAADVESPAWMEKKLDGIAQHVADNTGIPVDTMDKKKKWTIVDTMWSACQSDYVVNDITDQWCSVFTEDDIKALEFYDDLSAFYRKSYGHNISYLVSAPLFADIIENMKSNAEPVEDDYPIRANLRFGHAETILPLSALIGLFHKDGEVLTANMTDEEIEGRTWRFGAASPLAANIAFALYKCDNQDDPQVELLYNGVTYPLRGCDESRLCPLPQVIDSYSGELAIAKSYEIYCAVNNDHKDEL